MSLSPHTIPNVKTINTLENFKKICNGLYSGCIQKRDKLQHSHNEMCKEFSCIFLSKIVCNLKMWFQFVSVLVSLSLSLSLALCGLRSAETDVNQLKVHCHASSYPLMRIYVYNIYRYCYNRIYLHSCSTVWPPFVFACCLLPVAIIIIIWLN